MSLGQCIPGMIERGEIDPARGKRMAELFDQLERHYGKSLSPEAAAAEASEATLRQLAADAALKARQTVLQVAVQRRGIADMDAYTGKSAHASVGAMLDDDLAAPYENITRRAQAIEFETHAAISDFIQQHRRNFLGNMKDRAGGGDVVRELFGEATGNPRAATFAKAIAETFEELRLRFNAAGGAIAKLERWALPQNHDTLKVRRAGYEQWRADILAGIDPARMRSNTGDAFTDETLEDALRSAWENIRTGGLAGEPTSAFRGQGKMANRRSDHRFFVFKDADAWLAYQAKYGSGDVFGTIMGHMRGMAQDIATMERLGPNPDATMRYLLDAADKKNAQADTAHSTAAVGTSGGRWAVEQTWRYINGETRIPIEPENWLQGPPAWIARTFEGTRNLMTSAMLGSAPLSALSDLNTQRLARRFNGLPVVQGLLTQLKQMNPASAADRKLAIRLGLGMRDASRALMSLQRYYDTTHAHGWTSVVADDVLRLSGLNKWTEAGQRAFGLDFLGQLADVRARGFDDLDTSLRANMERYGIDAKTWDVIRAAEPERANGGEWVNARNIADKAASGRLMDMVLSETAAAVTESSAKVRAVLTGGQRPGTWTNFLLANTVQFKGFAATLLTTQAERMASLGRYQAARYGAEFFIGMTVFGAAAIQLREIAKARDFRPMESGEFWADAALQGGGAGIFGDVVGTFRNDRIGGFGELVAGPAGGFYTDVGRAIRTAMPGKERDDGTRRPGNPGGALIRLGKRYTPGGNLWYLRAAYERMVMDQLAEQIDPNYALSRARVERIARENEQGMWWAPGDVLPSRAPDLGNALQGKAPEPETLQ